MLCIRRWCHDMTFRPLDTFRQMGPCVSFTQRCCPKIWCCRGPNLDQALLKRTLHEISFLFLKISDSWSILFGLETFGSYRKIQWSTAIYHKTFQTRLLYINKIWKLISFSTYSHTDSYFSWKSRFKIKIHLHLIQYPLKTWNTILSFLWHHIDSTNTTKRKKLWTNYQISKCCVAKNSFP